VNAGVARTPSDYPEDEDDVEEATFEEEDEDFVTPRPHRAEETEDVFDWDGSGPADEPRRPSFRHEGPGELLPASGTPQPILLGSTPAQETTPLLHKAVSFSHDTHADHEHLATAPPKARRVSEGSIRKPKYEYSGKSTFGQTVSSHYCCLAYKLTIFSYSIVSPSCWESVCCRNL
jgi:hypothetical protein